MIKLKKQTVKNIIKNKGSWEGYLVGNKVHPWHIENGWHLGYTVKVESVEELNERINSILYYLEPQLGNNVAFYVEG
jgi:hypothetical protein